MSLNLIRLIKASGGTGTAGQSFRLNVSGAADTVKMTDYLMPARAWPPSGAPISGSTYTGTQNFTLTYTLTRNPKAHLIQNNTLSAWAITLAQYVGPGGSVTLSNFSAAGSPVGATHTFTMTVVPSKSGTLGVTGVMTFGTVLGGDLCIVVCNTTVTTSGGGVGKTTYRIGLQWRPDLGAEANYIDYFNPPIPSNETAYIPEGGGRPPAVAAEDFLVTTNNESYTDSDVEFEWYNTFADRAAGTNRLSTSPDFSSPPVNVPNGATVTFYLRWRAVGTPTWSLKTYSWTRVGAFPPGGSTIGTVTDT